MASDPFLMYIELNMSSVNRMLNRFAAHRGE